MELALTTHPPSMSGKIDHRIGRQTGGGHDRIREAEEMEALREGRIRGRGAARESMYNRQSRERRARVGSGAKSVHELRR